MALPASPTNLSLSANVIKRLAEIPTFAEEYVVQPNPANAQNVLIFHMNSDGTFPGTVDATSPNLMYILTPSASPLPIRPSRGGILNGEQVDLSQMCAISTANARLFINPINRY